MRKDAPERLEEEEEKKTGVDMRPSIRKLLEDEIVRRRRETGARWDLGALIQELVLDRYGNNGHAENGTHMETKDD